MGNIPGIPVWREIGTSSLRQAPQSPVQILIVGAGPVGLAMALDLGCRGHQILVLNKLDFVAAGSKAICFSKRSLEIFDRLGVGQVMVDKGVVWNLGKVFWGNDAEPIYQFDLLPQKDQKRPAFINLQQYHVEEMLLDAVSALPNVEIRWGHEVTGIDLGAALSRLSVRGGDTEYAIDARWVIACDGSRSAIRGLMGLDFDGRIFEDNFLIADIKMQQERSAERWFWFDPPFNPGQSALMHKQPDNIWRLDFQLGWNIDREACAKPENVERLIRAMLGPDVAFTEEWYSIYTFQCRRMARFVHGHVIFAGDSAHLVSPFGARGCNGGIADVDNLGWKLDLVLRGAVPEVLLESYNDEAIIAADENIRNSTRSTDFMTPKSEVSLAYRDAVLELAASYEFARPFVNSGRLSTAVHYPASSLNTPDEDVWPGGVAPGLPAVDAPIGDGWLLERLGGEFVLLVNGVGGSLPGGLRVLEVTEDAAFAKLRARYALRPNSAYLFRPDQYVAARWHLLNYQQVAAALARAKSCDHG